MNVLLLLLLIPLTVFVTPHIFNLEYGLVYGKNFDPGLAGIGYLGLAVPMVIIPLTTYLIYALFRKLVSPKFEYVTLLLIYIVFLFIFLHPYVVEFLYKIFFR